MGAQPTEAPGPVPQIIPEVPVAVATPKLPLLHVPPVTPSLNVVVPSWQKLNVPVIAVGLLTVNGVVVLLQRFAAVIVVVPALKLDITPVTASIVATLKLLLVHVPVGDPLLLNVGDNPKQIVVVPEMMVGADGTETVVV